MFLGIYVCLPEKMLDGIFVNNLIWWYYCEVGIFLLKY